MDWIAQKRRLWELLKQYRYVALVILIGLFLLWLPTESTPEPSVASEEPSVAQTTLQEELSQLLSEVSGAGKVTVLLTQAKGEETLYQEDARVSDTESQYDTVVITGSDRMETGLIRQVIPPIFQGAVVLCQGADSPQVQLAMVEAVKCATGLTADCITVLKMK